VTPAAPPLASPPRAPVGSARDVRARLGAQRPPGRPLLVSAYAALLGEAGLLGPASRRRLVRWALRSAPAGVAVGGSTLVVLRIFSDAPLGPAHAGAGAALAGSLGALAWRRVARARRGRRLTWREGLELGALALVLAFALAQASEVLAPGADAPLQPLVYLVLGTLVATLPRSVGGALVALALGLEAALWWSRGARPEDVPAVAAHAAFAVLFALLYHAVLGARMAAVRRAEDAAVERRRRDLDERARLLRLLAAGGQPVDGDRVERAARLAEAAVLETDAAARGLLEVAEAALGAHTVAAWLLSDDDAELRLWEGRSCSARVAERLPAGEGPLGGVVKRCAPVRLYGTVRFANHYDDGTRPRALLAVPLLARVGGHLRGVVLADRLDDRPFSEDDERLLARLATELARAATAERLILDGRASRDEKERFYGAIERLNRTTTPREVFDAVLEAAAGMVTVDFGAVTLFEPGAAGGPRHRVAHVTLAPGGAGEADGRSAPLDRATAGLQGKEFADNGGLVACAVRLGSTLPAKDLRLADAVVFDDATRLKGLASLKILPLRAGESVLGTMVVGARKAGAYQDEAVRQLEVVAMQAGDSILRARLFEATERLATTDGLTGLVNHRTFQGRLDEHLAAAQRYGKKVSLLLTDIDHFKAVNDTYGHPVGDAVLKGVARILQKEARTTDVAARYGGEEFAVVMPETDLAGALRTAERIREKVGQAVFRTEQGELRLTISIGVATFPQDARTKAELIELADGGLYHAKRHGRNQSVALSQLRGPRRAG
jgi:diguanylate cyclase (GGDEF)-like protein